MTCEAYRTLLDRALDGEATQAELEDMRQHEQSCTECAALHRELSSLQLDLASLKEEAPPMPEGLHQRWMTLVEEDTMENKSKGGRFRQQFTRFISVAAALVFVIGGTLLTRDDLAPRRSSTTNYKATQSETGYTTNDGGYVSGAPMMMASRAYGNGLAVASEDAFYADYDSDMAEMETMESMDDAAAVNPSKIIRTASLTIATRQYDESMEQLRSACSQYGGWISYSTESTTASGLHRANLTLRIPSQHLDAFLAVTGDAGRVTSRSETANDVSDSYYDTKTRLATQQALLARLQALITDAADLTDLLELENQIANTQYTIDRLSGSLQATDRQVDYATVDVTLREESAADEIVQTDLTLGQRMASAFVTGWQAFADFAEDLLVFIVAALPFLAIVIAVIVALRIIFKRSRARKNK